MKHKFLVFGTAKRGYLPTINSRRMRIGAGRHNIAYKTDGEDDETKDEGDEDPEALKKKLDELKASLATETESKAKKMIEKEIADLQKKLPTALQVKELQDQVKALTTNAEKNQKVIDDLQVKAAQTPANGAPKSLADLIGDELTKKEKALKAYREGEGKGFSISMDRKLVGNFSSASSLTGSYFVTPQLVPGVVLQPYEEVHMRNILPVGQTNSNMIRYVRDMGGEGGPDVVAEAAAKPQMDRDLEMFDAPVRKIATHMRVPEEMIEDIPYLQSLLVAIGTEEVMLVEDQEILYGDGTGQHLSGLAENSTAFSGAGLGIGGASGPDPNHFDVLRAARTQARLLKRRPTVALVNPAEYYKMESTKDSTGNYMLLGGGNGINPGRNVSGLTVIDHTEVEPGDFFVLDPRAAMIFDRTGLSVRFYDQDQDNAIKNLITIVIEKRLALPIFYETGIIYGNFEEAIDDLDDAS